MSNNDVNRGGHPDVTDEDIGRRTVEVRRERAVERAVELTRVRLGTRWSELSTLDVERIRWTLGEVWGHMPRAGWDALTFSALSFDDVQALLELSDELSAATYGTSRILDRIVELLKAAAENAALLEEEEE